MATLKTNDVKRHWQEKVRDGSNNREEWQAAVSAPLASFIAHRNVNVIKYASLDWQGDLRYSQIVTLNTGEF